MLRLEFRPFFRRENEQKSFTTRREVDFSEAYCSTLSKKSAERDRRSQKLMLKGRQRFESRQRSRSRLMQRCGKQLEGSWLSLGGLCDELEDLGTTCVVRRVCQ